MPRPRSFAPADAVRAARDRFWAHGYEATSLADLESATGLSRSSLYQAFGPKRLLFGLAMDSYLAEVAWPRLGPVEAPDAGIRELAGYFTALGAALHAGGELATRGCLIVNTITELGAHDPQAHAVGAAYRARIRDAFAAALDRALPAADAARRADVLVGLVVGVLVTARLSPGAAADLAGATATEVAGWSR